jgi:general L-amino acid transport system substrate-binding protein
MAMNGNSCRLIQSNLLIILKDIISKEPLGPVVRQGDDKWFNIVKWSLNAMIGAEEFGINSLPASRKSHHLIL